MVEGAAQEFQGPMVAEEPVKLSPTGTGGSCGTRVAREVLVGQLLLDSIWEERR